MLAYAFFHGPSAPPGLAGRAARAGLPTTAGGSSDPEVVDTQFVDGGVAVGLASGPGPAALARDEGSRTALVGSIRLDDPAGLRRALAASPDEGDAALVLETYLAWDLD